MRSLLSLAASALAALGAVISSIDFHADYVPFFVGLTMLGAVNAWAVDDGHRAARRWVAMVTALLWAIAAAWVGVLLVMSITVWQASGPPPVPETAFAGIPATFYRTLGLFAGAGLVLAATFAQQRRVGTSESAST